ncbi:MAG: transaldolase family protein [Nitrosotalea sp.]
MTKFLLDSGDPQEYKELQQLARENDSELWGSTTNPSLIAKKLSGKKITPEEAFKLQKELVLEIVKIVPGAVSAEVYATQNTTAEDMIVQGLDIATWHERVVVKLPTTSEGFKARTALRQKGITINNTLVFSQEQIFAISLHEKIMLDSVATKATWPCFISPFVGRLDDKGQNGMSLVSNGMRIITDYFPKDTVWMLEASVRNAVHLKKGIELNSDLITAPLKAYTEWFAMTKDQQDSLATTAPAMLTDIPAWTPSQELQNITTIEAFMNALANGSLNISHPLTTTGIDKFVADWQAILS